jgi:hypothetical protein
MTVTSSHNGVLQTQSAVVRTAAAYVKALMIEKHQVTLAVFRQLRDEQLLDPESAALAGVPWGTVNYHPASWGCPPEDQHLHVVWQRGDYLRRSLVVRSWPAPGWFHTGDRIEDTVRYHAERWLLAQLASGAALQADAVEGYAWVVPIAVPGLPGVRLGFSMSSPHWHVPGGSWDMSAFTTIICVGLCRELSIFKTMSGATSWVGDLLGHDRHAELDRCGCERSRDRLRQALDVAGVVLGEETEQLEELGRQYSRLTRRAEAATAAWDRQYAALEQLDQLFIAV